MTANEGKYHLICNYDKYNVISNCRIAEIKLLDTPEILFEKLDVAEKQLLNLSIYTGEHIYMFSNKTVLAKFV